MPVGGAPSASSYDAASVALSGRLACTPNSSGDSGLAVTHAGASSTVTENVRSA